MSKIIPAEHGIVYARPDDDPFDYFGWPTAAKGENGEIRVVVSGFRAAHVCPFGKTVLFRSADEGKTWSAPAVIGNSMIDDRDAGILPLPGGKALVSWFTSDTRTYFTGKETFLDRRVPDFNSLLAGWDDTASMEIGSFVRLFGPDGPVSPRIRVMPSAPHGPIRLKDGTLFYIGRRFAVRYRHGELAAPVMDTMHDPLLCCAVSRDGGLTWTETESAPFLDDAPEKGGFCEPHAIELNDGRILALMRTNLDETGKMAEPAMFSIWQSVSDDRGKTWSRPVHIAHGAPPHLMRHRSGLLLCSYGWRGGGGFGQRVMFSRDEGKTWDADWIINRDGIDGDLGYPSTVELSDGSLLTVYYQKPPGNRRNAGVLYSRWRLPF